MKDLTIYWPHTVRELLGSSGTLGDFDRCFGTFFGESPSVKGYIHQPAVDFRESDKDYVLDMELPGYSEKDIEIHVDGSNLTINSRQEENSEKKDENQGTWILKERRISSFSRSFKLPENANPDEVSAEFKNGVLSLELKKRPEAQKRPIQIKVA